MKNKRAEDKNNWKAEWIKGGGDEMVQSLATLFNRINKKTIPIQWRETKIKSIYKGGNIEQIQESHKGIFLMDMCKVYETVKKL